MVKIRLIIVIASLMCASCAKTIPSITVFLNKTTDNEVISQLGEPDKSVIGFQNTNKDIYLIIQYEYRNHQHGTLLTICNEDNKCITKSARRPEFEFINGTLAKAH